uniref:Virion morphogenesis protein n=1 Tax=Myoviridae sp. ctbEa13 TaxID=2825136 RepID=A0A8S5VBE3_9CAUD|nr:MAG TPA: virion morphogenesis protein [Myoviridae sp. ctbEa13]
MADFKEQFKQKYSSIPTYFIELGVFAPNSTRKRTKVLLGVTNAELMYIHEKGSPINNIPSRPVLRMTIDYTKQQLLAKSVKKALQLYVQTGSIEQYEAELNRLCMRVQQYARQIIYSNDGRLAPNSPAVAARKKGNHPLFDTGQLARSITCRLVKG